MKNIFTKTIKSLIIVLVLVSIKGELFSQQLPMFTQYREFHGFINPATINSDFYVYEYDLSFGASFRNQWSGVDNFTTPQTAFIRGEYIIGGSGYKFGLVTGGYLIHDDTDPISNTGLYGRLGVMYSDDPYWGLFSVGLTVGAVQYRIKTSNIRLQDYTDEVVFQAQLNQIYPDVGFGMFFHKRFESGFFKYDSFYAGLSVPQVFGLNLDYRESDDNLSLKRNQHFFGLIGFYKYLNEDSFLEPSIWVKYVSNVPVHIDFSLRYQLSNYFWFGAGMAMNGNMHYEIGFLLGDNIGWYNTNIKVGYGYGTFYKNVQIFGPSHEINFTYTFDTKG